ncbi:MAG: FMN reductase RutF [Candidatus Alkanophagales archaeon MCA70_species_2]|nr:FMN reductase RutF [Candidatus Alkanophaga liquidiphilum]
MGPGVNAYAKLLVRPVVVITTVSDNGIPNAAPFSFNSPISFDPPLYGFSCSPAQLMGMLSYPLSIFNLSNPEKEKKFYKGLVKSLKEKLENWEKYKPIRGMIENIFKLAKNAFSLKNLHRYTKRSVKRGITEDC